MNVSRYQKHLLILFILLLRALNLDAFSKDSSEISDYLKFIHACENHLGPVGDHSKGEIEIITDPGEICQVQEDYKQRLIRRGISENEAERWSQVGIIEGDAGWIWIRDAVILPSGRKTIKGRLNWKTSIDGPQGVATLAILENKDVVVCVKYKHSMRSWQIELPWGSRKYGESAVEAANRELRNETGFIGENLLFLGTVAASSANFNTLTPVFLSYVKGQVEPGNIDERAVLGFLTLSKDEIKEALLKGYIHLKLHNKVQKVAVNDANLSFALLQAEIRGLL